MIHIPILRLNPDQHARLEREANRRAMTIRELVREKVTR